MYKLYISVALMLSLVMGPVLAGNGQSVSAQNYGYDDYSDSSYSEYPSKDNKVQCKKGPFQGFFVSSVEWCDAKKFDDDKFDDKKIIKQGPKGDKGDKGDPGPKGDKGDPGKDASKDPQIACEECFKFWLHFLTPDQVRVFLNALIDAINFENFGRMLPMYR